MKRLISRTMEWLRIACLALGLTAAAAALGSLMGAVSAQFDILGHFTPLWFVAGCAALGVALISRAGPASWIAALTAIGIGGAMMIGEVGAAAAAAVPSPAAERLTLIQCNLWAHNADPAATARWIEAQHADLLSLEETAGRGAVVVEMLKGDYPHQIAGRSGDDTLILSRVAPAASGPIGEQSSPSGVWARFGEGERAITLVAAHLTWPIPAGPQAAQMTALARTLDRLASDRLILAGDFNSTPWSFALRRQDANLRRIGLRRVTRALFTWPTPLFHRLGLASPVPLLPIDHVYVGRGWRPVSVARGPALGSDHWPVKVVVERAAEAGRSAKAADGSLT